MCVAQNNKSATVRICFPKSGCLNSVINVEVLRGTHIYYLTTSNVSNLTLLREINFLSAWMGEVITREFGVLEDWIRVPRQGLVGVNLFCSSLLPCEHIAAITSANVWSLDLDQPPPQPPM